MRQVVINIYGDNLGIVSDFIVSYLDTCTLVKDYSVCFDVPCYECRFCKEDE